jgi:uncharacterized protein (UPF0179 family)
VSLLVVVVGVVIAKEIVNMVEGKRTHGGAKKRKESVRNECEKRECERRDEEIG